MQLSASQIERKSSSSRPCQNSPLKDLVKEKILDSPDVRSALNSVLDLSKSYDKKTLIGYLFFQLPSLHKDDKNLASTIIALIDLVSELNYSNDHISKGLNFCKDRISEVGTYIDSNPTIMKKLSPPIQPQVQNPTTDAPAVQQPTSQDSKPNSDNLQFSDFKNDSVQNAGEVIFVSPVFLPDGTSSKYLDYKLEQYSLASSDFSIGNFNPDPVKTSGTSFDPINLPFKEEDKKEDEIEVQETTKKSTPIKMPSTKYVQNIHKSRKKTTKTQSGQLIYTPPVNRFISPNASASGGGKMKKPNKLDPLKELRNMKRPVQKDLDVRTVMGIGSATEKSDQKPTKKTKEVMVYEKPAKPVVVPHPDRIKNAVIAFRAKYQIIVPPTLKEKALALLPRKDQNKDTSKPVQKQPDTSIAKKPTSSNVIVVKQKENPIGMSIQMNATLTPTQRLLKKVEPPANVVKPPVSQSSEVTVVEPKPIAMGSVTKPAGKKGPMRSERSRLLFSEFASSEKKPKPKN